MKTYSLAISMLLVACACDSTVHLGDPKAGPDAAMASPGCDSLCKTLSDCSLMVDSICTIGCEANVSAVGTYGEAVVEYCAACIQKLSCADVASNWGSCASACPFKIAMLGTVTGGADAGSSSGQDAGMPQSCKQTWTEPEDVYEVHCALDTYYMSYTCYCFHGGIEGTEFGSSDFCAVDKSAAATRAEKACGWTLGKVVMTCGSGPATDQSCMESAAGSCEAQSGTSADFQQGCEGATGRVYSAGPCATSGRVGGCLLAATYNALYTYYSPMTVATAQQSCTSAGGTFCP